MCHPFFFFFFFHVLHVQIKEVNSGVSDYLFVETKPTPIAVRISGGSVRTVTYRRKVTYNYIFFSFFLNSPLFILTLQLK